MVPLLLALSECPSIDAGVEPGLACFLDKTPRCPADRPHCVGLHLHLADGATQTPAWTAASMAHELGHFFGLPHSGFRDSIMNKRPRTRPTWEERVFVAEELEIVARERDAMFADGSLVDPR